MKKLGITIAFATLLFSSLSWATLPSPTSNPSVNAKGTSVADNVIGDNYVICANQWLSLIDSSGDSSDKATEFRLLMSIKCGEKAKKGLFFGMNSIANPSRKAELAVNLLKKIYPRVSTAKGQKRVRDLIAMIQQTPEYPKQAAYQSHAEADAAQ